MLSADTSPDLYHRDASNRGFPARHLRSALRNFRSIFNTALSAQGLLERAGKNIKAFFSAVVGGKNWSRSDMRTLEFQKDRLP